jgi:hypothetical protein
MDERPPWERRRPLKKVATDTAKDMGLVVGVIGVVIVGAILSASVTAILMVTLGAVVGLLFVVALLVGGGVFWLAREFR